MVGNASDGNMVQVSGFMERERERERETGKGALPKSPHRKPVSVM